jgi:recombinational DNA repair protein (RecF pathway)
MLGPGVTRCHGCKVEVDGEDTYYFNHHDYCIDCVKVELVGAIEMRRNQLRFLETQLKKLEGIQA